MASSAVKVKFRGIPQIDRKLQRATERIKRRVIKKGINAGANPIVKGARRLATQESGQLKKSIGKKVVTYRNNGIVMAVIGPRRGFKIIYNGKPRDPANYGHLVEFGTIKTSAKPYLRPSYDQNKGAATTAFKNKVKKEVKKEARKL